MGRFLLPQGWTTKAAQGGKHVASPSGEQPDFHIYTAGMIADTKNPLLVRMVGSSTEVDLHGDEMTLNALNDMSRAQPGMTIWLNHDYTLPDSVFGSLAESPTITQKNGVADLHLTVEATDLNPAAMKTLAYIRSGKITLGCSIGCKVLKYEPILDGFSEDDPFAAFFAPMRILSVQTLEWSVVGIPANQRSWVENAVRGVFQRTLDPKLAPAVKSLWPRQYAEIVKGIEDADLREELTHNVKARPTVDSSIKWVPETKTFVMRSGNIDMEIDRDDLADTLTAMPAVYRKRVLEEMKKDGGRAQESVMIQHTDEPAPEAAEPEDEQPQSADEVVAAVETPMPDDVAEPESEEAPIEAPAEDTSELPAAEELPAAKSEEAPLTADINLLKGACGSSSWPLGSRDAAWDNGAATKAVESWADGDASKLKSVHFYVDSSADPKTISAYKLLFCDVVDGAVKAMPKGIFACAGSHGVDAADIPSGDKATIRNKISAYYRKMAKEFNDDTIVAPWDKEDSIDPMKKSMLDLYNKWGAELGFEARSFGEITKKDFDAQRCVSLAQQIDDASDSLAMLSDQLLDCLGIPDNDGDEGGTEDDEVHMSADKLLQRGLALVKAGARHSAADMASIKAVHDAVVQLAGTMYCAPDGGHDGDEKSADVSTTKSVDFDSVLLKMHDMAQALSAIKIDAVQADVTKATEQLATLKAEAEKLKTDADLARKLADDARAEAQAAHADVLKLKDMPLGRPTGFLGRSVKPDEGAASFEQMMAIAHSSDAGQNIALKDALEQTVIIYQKGTGMCRQWPDGLIPDGGRPKLSADQMTVMTDAECRAYRDGREALVPITRQGE